MFGVLVQIGVVLALLYFIVWVTAPGKWLFSLSLLIYAVAMVFIADEIRAELGSSNVAYAVLDTSVIIATCFFFLIPLVYGIFRLCLFPFVRDSAKRDRLSTNAYWLVAGILVPLTPLDTRLFARYPGTALMLVLLGTSALALAAFFLLRRRAPPKSLWLFLPGYALGVPIMLAVSLYYGAKVLPAARATAQGMPFCIERGDGYRVTSLFDMTPLTLVSREFSEFHAELVVETLPKPGIYNWSWRTLSFSPVKPDRYFERTCAEK